MENESDHGESLGSPEGPYAEVHDERGSPVPAETTSSDVPRIGRRRLLRTLRTSAYVVLAGGLFGGGWFSHAAFRGGSSSSSSHEDELVAALFPEDGVTLKARWGDLPQRLVPEW